MGGNLFKLGRRPRAEYLGIEARVREVLDRRIPDGYRIPRYYASKPDFGDLDVVVSGAAITALGGWDEFRAVLATDLDVTRTKSVGHVYSTVVDELQVDYFVREPELFAATYHYLSFNDLGNLIGKIYRRLGLKYGEHGLSYVFRRESQPSYKRELQISRDWPRILAFLELDVATWEAGFDRLEDMFTWVVASPYFSVAPYEPAQPDRPRDRKTEQRAKHRPTMAGFMEWLERESVTRRYEYRPGRDAYVEQISAAFPEANLIEALAHERTREGEDNALRQKFGGDQVRAWTGLDGPQLGAFLRRFTQTYSHEVLAAMEPEAIRAAVERFPSDD